MKNDEFLRKVGRQGAREVIPGPCEMHRDPMFTIATPRKLLCLSVGTLCSSSTSNGRLVMARLWRHQANKNSIGRMSIRIYILFTFVFILIDILIYTYYNSL